VVHALHVGVAGGRRPRAGRHVGQGTRPAHAARRRLRPRARRGLAARRHQPLLRRHPPPVVALPNPPLYLLGGPVMLKNLGAPLFGRGQARRGRWPSRLPLSLEALGERIAPAVTASFIPGAGVLSVFGDALDNTIVISRNAAGTILVNGGAVAVQGGTP